MNESTALPVQLKLSKAEIKLLRGSWSSIVSKADISVEKSMDKMIDPSSSMFASSTFWIQVYETILDEHPELERILPSIKHQTVSFASTVYMAILNLEDLSRMGELLGNLGRRHSRVFCVEPSHFEQMGIALVDTLYKRLSDIKVIELWTRLYCFLANSLIQAGLEDPMFTDEMLIDSISLSHNFNLNRVQTRSKSVASSTNLDKYNGNDRDRLFSSPSSSKGTIGLKTTSIHRSLSTKTSVNREGSGLLKKNVGSLFRARIR